MSIESYAARTGRGSATKLDLEVAPVHHIVTKVSCPISPLIEAGTVYRGAGRIDHSSVLRTIHDRLSTVLLTARDTAAASLGDVLTLWAARDDGPIAGVAVPVSIEKPSNTSLPSRLDMMHAAKVAALRVRTATWNQHVQLKRRRRGGTTPSASVSMSST